MRNTLGIISSIAAIGTLAASGAYMYFEMNSRIAELEGKMTGFETIAFSGTPSNDTREKTCSALAVRVADEIDKLGYSGVTADSLREVMKEYGCTMT